MAAAGSFPKFMSSLALGGWLGFQYQTCFLVVEQVLSLIGKLFVIAKVCLSITDPSGIHTMLVIAVVHVSIQVQLAPLLDDLTLFVTPACMADSTLSF